MAHESPNILIIMSDQHNKSFMGCAGHPAARTPNLDRLAAQGMRFTNAYCNSPLCTPSRMSFLTGRLPSANRVWTNGQILSSAIPTFAHALGAAGYETALLGRMDFRGPDQRHGFEHRPLGEEGARHPGAPGLGGPSDPRIPSSAHNQFRECLDTVGRGRYYHYDFDDRVTQATCEFLRSRGGAHGRPFAAVAGFVLPHCPFIAPPELFDYYLPRVNGAQPSLEETGRQPTSVRRFRHLRGLLDPIPEKTVRHARAAYLGMCEYMDACVGRMLRALEESGLAERTLVLYVSDHGEMAGEHGCWWKCCYYEGSVGVPMLARWPGAVPAGSECGAVCSLADVGPTLIELAGGEPLPGIYGRSFFSLLQGRRQAGWREEAIAELLNLKKITEPPSAMIRRGRWKLWTYEGDPTSALYDLEEDPRELNDLGVSPSHAETKAGLLARLREVWDPAFAQKAYEEEAAALQVITAWGQAVKPVLPETLPHPAPYTNQVEML